MRRDRKSKIRRERMIMVASSALVMGALTMTGIYMKGQSDENVDDGYTLDFSALEDSIDNKAQEIAQNRNADKSDEVNLAQDVENEDALDYYPVEAGSGLVEIPGLTDVDPLVEKNNKPIGFLSGLTEIEGAEEEPHKAPKDEKKEEVSRNDEKETGSQTASAAGVAVTKELAFSEGQGLIRPVVGDILMHYSMDRSIYFATLDQYKYNPAVVFIATEGEAVLVCADAKVVSVFKDAQIGQAVTLDLGNGYQVTYGQLKDVEIAEGSYVNAGDILGRVATPTKYYTVEGTNLYFKMTKGDEPVNPEIMF